MGPIAFVQTCCITNSHDIGILDFVGLYGAIADAVKHMRNCLEVNHASLKSSGLSPSAIFFSAALISSIIVQFFTCQQNVLPHKLVCVRSVACKFLFRRD